MRKIFDPNLTDPRKLAEELERVAEQLESGEGIPADPRLAAIQIREAVQLMRQVDEVAATLLGWMQSLK